MLRVLGRVKITGKRRCTNRIIVVNGNFFCRRAVQDESGEKFNIVRGGRRSGNRTQYVIGNIIFDFRNYL